MNLWLTEVVAAAHVDELLRQAGQPVGRKAGDLSSLRAERLPIYPSPAHVRTAARVRPRIGGLLIRAGTRLGGAGPVGPLAAGTGC